MFWLDVPAYGTHKNGMQSFSAIGNNISLLGMSSLGALLGDLFMDMGMELIR